MKCYVTEQMKMIFGKEIGGVEKKLVIGGRRMRTADGGQAVRRSSFRRRSCRGRLIGG